MARALAATELVAQLDEQSQGLANHWTDVVPRRSMPSVPLAASLWPRTARTSTTFRVKRARTSGTAFAQTPQGQVYADLGTFATALYVTVDDMLLPDPSPTCPSALPITNAYAPL
ncbi:MAG: hypothetical protein ACP5VR_06275 [Acidimicrobiales bacterium]